MKALILAALLVVPTAEILRERPEPDLSHVTGAYLAGFIECDYTCMMEQLDEAYKKCRGGGGTEEDCSPGGM